jgi:uncharacterized protein YbaR (Trm112 family)
MPGPRRSIKLPLTEIPMKCPHCNERLIVATVMGKIILGRRTCPRCEQEFMIDNNVPRLPDDGMKKPNTSVKPVKNARRSRSR